MSGVELTASSSSKEMTPDQVAHQSAIRLLLDGESDWDKRLIAASDWVNPILIKETRQALKSRQFVWTFLLMVILVLGWSLIGIVSMIPSIYYASNGSGLLYGYALILIVPSIIIIPQVSFRSMAAELEDGTFETLSLSTLSPRQIVLGKLSISVVQLIIYLSIVTPCIALTYLLRGVTLEQITAIVWIVVLSSISLSVVGLTFASLSISRMLQVLFSLVLIGLQVGFAIYVGVFIQVILNYGMYGWVGWVVLFVTTLFCILYGWLFLRCASAMIGMASDNRSTPIRVPLLTIGLIIATMGSFFIVLLGDQSQGSQSVATSLIATLANVLTLHWGIAGMLIVGEQGIIPARARRTLPSSILGRLFLTWLNPGAGPGYVFVLLSLGAALTTMSLTPAIVNADGTFELFLYNATLWAFVAVYIGIARLSLLFFMKHLAQGRMIVSTAITLVLITVAVIGSCSISLAMNDYRELSYGWYCAANPFWTLYEMFPYRTNLFWDIERTFGMMMLYFTALVIVMINVLFVTRDVVILRIKTPERVLLERQQSRTATSSNAIEY